MKKTLLSLILIPTVTFAALEPDLRKGIDLTATNGATYSMLNQLADNGTIRDTGSFTNNKGIVMRSTVRPDITLNPRMTNWLWLDMRNSSSNGVGTLRQYVPTGDADTNWVIAAVGNGSIVTANIADFSITAVKMATNSIQNYAIVDGAIDSRTLAFQSVTAGKIAPNSVSNLNIAPSEIDGGRIALNTISNLNLYDYTITALKISPGAIMDFAITNGGLTGSNVIRPFSLTGTNLANNTITNGQLALNAISSNNIAPAIINFANVDTNLSYGVPVMWGFVLSNGTLARGLGCSVAYSGGGLYTITFNTARSTTNYCVGSTAHDDANGRIVQVVTRATTTLTVRVRNTTAGTATVEDFSFQIFDF